MGNKDGNSSQVRMGAVGDRQQAPCVEEGVQGYVLSGGVGQQRDDSGPWVGG